MPAFLTFPLLLLILSTIFCCCCFSLLIFHSSWEIMLRIWRVFVYDRSYLHITHNGLGHLSPFIFFFCFFIIFFVAIAFFVSPGLSLFNGFFCVSIPLSLCLRDISFSLLISISLFLLSPSFCIKLGIFSFALFSFGPSILVRCLLSLHSLPSFPFFDKVHCCSNVPHSTFYRHAWPLADRSNIIDASCIKMLLFCSASTCVMQAYTATISLHIDIRATFRITIGLYNNYAHTFHTNFNPQLSKVQRESERKRKLQAKNGQAMIVSP